MKTLGRKAPNPWGFQILTGQSVTNIGLPAAMRIVAKYDGLRPYVPAVIKPFPTETTYLYLKKEDSKAATLDVFVNNFGDLKVKPVLTNAAAKPVKMKIIMQKSHRIFQPDFSKPLHHDIWYGSYGEHIFYRLRIPKRTRPGIYQLHVGDEVSFSLLHSDIENVVQYAPDGMVLMRAHKYFFKVPVGMTEVKFFSSRPIKVTDSSGAEIEIQNGRNGWRSFSVEGKKGPFSMRGGQDKYLHPGTPGLDPFVRMANIPFVAAMDEPQKLFDAKPTYPPDTEREVVPKARFPVGRFGKAVRLYQEHVAIPLPGADELGDVAEKGETSQEGKLPTERGTVEFWMKSYWSATKFDHVNSTQRFMIYHTAPISFSYYIDPDNSGRTGRYNIASLDFHVHKAGYSRARFYLRRGKWYHFALTWNVDGKNSFCNVFINGRKKSFFHYKGGMRANAKPEQLLPADTAVRLGSGHQYGRGTNSELFDELRISKTVRYMKDFSPPDKPFKPDKQTYLLLHFDGDLKGELIGEEITGALKGGRVF